MESILIPALIILSVLSISVGFYFLYIKRRNAARTRIKKRPKKEFPGGPSSEFEHSNFAFISYAREDAKAAAWLQKKLEWFRIPNVAIRKDRLPKNPKYIREIYRDKTHLSHNEKHYWENIEGAICASKFLIVLCSKSSVRSRGVNREINRFLQAYHEQPEITEKRTIEEEQKIERIRFLIPVILDGSFTAKKTNKHQPEESRCLPCSLEPYRKILQGRNLPNMRAEGERKKEGWERGLVGVVSHMLDLDPIVIANHVAKEERKRIRRTLIISVLLGMLMVAASYFGWLASKREKETRAQLERSQYEEGRVWLEKARTADRGKRPFLSAMLAGRALGFRSFGWREGDTLRPGELYSPLLGEQFISNVRLEEKRRIMAAEAEELIRRQAKNGTLLWSSPLIQQHSDSISSISFSSDGHRMASGSEDHTVKIWNLSSGGELSTLSGHESSVIAIAFSEDGKILMTGDADGIIKRWNVDTGDELNSVSGGVGGCSCMAFSPNLELVATGTAEGSVNLLFSRTGDQVAPIEGHSEAVTSVAFSPDGQLVASGSLDERIKIWETSNGNNKIEFWEYLAPRVHHIAFSPDSNQILTAGDFGRVMIWDISTGNSTQNFESESSFMNNVAFSPDGHIIAGSGERPNTVTVREVATGEILATLDGLHSPIQTIMFTPDSSRIAIGNGDGVLELLDVVTGGELAFFSSDSAISGDIAFSPDGRLIASGSEDGCARLWDLYTGLPLPTFAEHNAAVTSVAFSSDGLLLATGSEDRTAKIWDVRNERLLFQLTGSFSEISKVVFSPGSDKLATQSFDKIQIWSVASGKRLAEVTASSGWTNDVEFSEDGARVAALDLDTLGFWSSENGSKYSAGVTRAQGKLTALDRHFDRLSLRSVALSPDQNFIALGYEDGSVSLVDPTGEFETTLIDAPSASVKSLAFSSNGLYLAAGLEDGIVNVWDVGNRALIAQLETGASSVSSVCFSADSRMLATLGGTLKIWEVVNGIVLSGHENDVACVSFNESDRTLASGTVRGEVHIWDVATGIELATLERDYAQKLESVMFSENGSRLAALGGGDLVLWDAGTGNKIGDSGSISVNCFAFDTSGQWLLTGTYYDGTIRLLDLGNYNFQDLGVIGGLRDVLSIAFSHDNFRFASASNREVKVFDFASRAEIASFKWAGSGECRVAFSVDGRRVYVKSASGELRGWDVDSRKELEFFSENLFSSLHMSGAHSAVIESNRVMLWRRGPAISNPDLFGLQRERLFQMEESRLVWGTSNSIVHSRQFPPSERLNEAHLNLISAVSERDEAIAKLEVLARGRQWLAASAVFRDLESGPQVLDVTPEIRNLYMMILLDRARYLLQGSGSGVVDEILVEIAELVEVDSAADVRVSLPLAGCLIAAALNPHLCSEESWEELVRAVILKFPSVWRKNVRLRAQRVEYLTEDLTEGSHIRFEKITSEEFSGPW